MAGGGADALLHEFNRGRPIGLLIETKEEKGQRDLRQWLRRPMRAMEGRVYGFNVAAAKTWAKQQVLFSRAGVRMPLADSFIAASAMRYGLTVLTGNEKDFRRPGVKVLNPFKS